MTFFIRKQLALGPIRFGVSARQREEKIDDDPALSTGPGGEFVRRRHSSGYFFGSQARFDEPTLPTAPSISSTPFWTSLKPDGTTRSYVFLGLMGFGALLVLLGLAVLVRKGAAGWVEILAGLALIAIPIIMTAQQRKAIRHREENERIARESRERKNRKLLSSYLVALDRLHRERDDAALANLARERQALTLPYDIWGSAARRLVLLIGFDELAKRGVGAAREISEQMSRASKAAGLTPEDDAGTKRDLYATVVWHLLADDRLGGKQQEEVAALRDALGIAAADVPIESKAIDEFQRLRGVTSRNLPKSEAVTSQLAFQEYAILNVNGITVTNRRLIVQEKKKVEVPLPQVNDVDVDVDADTMTITTAVTKKPIELRAPDPIYSAAIVDLAASIDERPHWQ